MAATPGAGPLLAPAPTARAARSCNTATGALIMPIDPSKITWDSAPAPSGGLRPLGPPPVRQPTPQTPDQAAYDASNAQYKQYQTQSQPIYDRATAIDKARDGYRQDKRVLKYEEAIPIYISGLQSQGNPAGDLLLVNSFAKVNDPITGVQQREGDQASNAQPTTEQLKAQLLKQFGDDGYGNFTPEGRKRMRDTMTVRMRKLADQYRQARSDQASYIKSLNLPGVDPEVIMGPSAGIPFQEAEQAYTGHAPTLNYRQGPNGIVDATTGVPIDPKTGQREDPSQRVGPDAGGEALQDGEFIRDGQLWYRDPKTGDELPVLRGGNVGAPGTPSAEDNAYVDQQARQAGASGAYIAGLDDIGTFGAGGKVLAGIGALGDSLGGDGSFVDSYRKRAAMNDRYESQVAQQHPV